MSYSATILANNILSRSFRDGIFITPMKLQKILYFVASEYSKKSDEPLFDEPFLTWDYGPVLRSVYDEFRPFSKRHITSAAKKADGKSYMANEENNETLRVVLDSVWLSTKDRSAKELSEITHHKGSAWYNAFQEDKNELSPEEVKEDCTYQEELKL